MPGGRRGASGKTSDSGAFGAARYPSAWSKPSPAMAIVAVYKFRAIFRNTATQKHDLPRDGLSREGLLLLRQPSDVRSDASAIAACASHGAFDAAIERYSLLDPAALDDPRNAAFVPLHAAALSGGSAMMYYVNSAPPEEAPSVTFADFLPAAGPT